MSLPIKMVFGVVLICAGALLGTETPTPAPAERKPIYQTDGQGMARVEQTLVRAAKENKRVLLMVGGNWCPWCHKLHHLFDTDQAIRSVLNSEYELVMVDSQADESVLAKWKIEPQGYPYLTVLDPSGKKVTEQETGSLEIGNAHDPKKVLAFLEKWKPTPQEAGKVFAAALKQAQAEHKKVFIRIGAPWCGWCRRMDKFLAQPPIAKIMDKDYVVVKIDQQRMKNAQAVIAKIRKPTEGGGIPWFAYLDAQGNIVVTSTRPGGSNVGFPVDQQTEIPHFVNMLKQTRSRISDADIESVVAALIAADPRRSAGTQQSH